MMSQVELDIPRSWMASARRIQANGWCRILVIGAVDRGKSSYCHFLANHLSTSGAKVAFVDADVGQKDVGPPATISLAYLQRDTALSQAEPAGGYFVGDTSPIGHFLPMIVGTRRMVAAAQASYVIIDTSGLIHGAGLVLKQYQIDSLQPDVIIALEKGNELETLLRSQWHHNIIRLRPSPRAAGKSARVRRALRQQAFRRYLDAAGEMYLDVRRLIFQRSPLFTGEPIEDARFLYAEQTTEGYVAVRREGGWLKHEKGWRSLPANFADGLLCGLADQGGEYLGLGIVKEIDFSQLKIALYTPVPKGRIRIVQFGNLSLSRDGLERRNKTGRS